MESLNTSVHVHQRCRRNTGYCFSPGLDETIAQNHLLENEAKTQTNLRGAYENKTKTTKTTDIENHNITTGWKQE